MTRFEGVTENCEGQCVSNDVVSILVLVFYMFNF